MTDSEQYTEVKRIKGITKPVNSVLGRVSDGGWRKEIAGDAPSFELVDSEPKGISRS